jgi:hypothetical protein
MAVLMVVVLVANGTLPRARARRESLLPPGLSLSVRSVCR